MEGNQFQFQSEFQQKNITKLLELAAVDDVTGFISEIQNGSTVDESGFWYCRKNPHPSSLLKYKMGFEQRTPLMIASLYGSIRVLKYIISTNKIDINKPSGSDGSTALHCAAAGGCLNSVEVGKMLIEAGGDVSFLDGNGNKPGDLIPRGIRSSVRKGLEMLLKGFVSEEMVPVKKEYPVDVSLPDINNELYGSDEFRMYSFKVKPCSRAYTHDWTECPFVHPGENARRRDPKKFSYSCVPCPEFRKGSCGHGDGCEYAHGVFESWLHPAQYKTRLCKDETGCARKVCFFAHRVEELRPLYASTGSAIPSPKSESLSELGSLSSMSPIHSPIQNSSPMTLVSTPPMSPAVSGVNGWQNNSHLTHLTPPVLQLSGGSRLRTALNARDVELQRQQIIDDLGANLYSIDDVLGSFDSSLFSSMQSPSDHQEFRRNSPPLRGNYASSPIRKPTNFGFDSSAAVAQAVMNSRSGAFAKQRSQSFIDRGAGAVGSPLSQWGSPDGKVDWGFNGEEANKLRKSASFGIRNVTHVRVGVGLYSSPEKKRYGDGDQLPQWVERLVA